MHSSAPPFSLLTVLQLYILPPSVHNIPFFQYLHVLEQQTVATCYSLFPVSSLHIHSTILLLQTIFFTYRLFNKRKTFNFNISHKISCYQTVNKKFVAQYIFQSNFMALQPNAGHGLLILDEVSRSHTTTHHSRQDSSGRVISPLPENTQHSQQTNIHASGGIRTHNLTKRN